MSLDILGQRLLTIRKLIGISRREMREKYNISENTIKVWERGKAEIGIIKLLNYLNIFKEYGVFINIGDFLDFRTNNYINNITVAYRNNSIHNLKKEKDLQLISDTRIRAMNLVLEKNETTLQYLFDNSPLKIVFKDENNNILRLNNLAADGLGGIVSDFEGKSVYNLFPQRAKKYHDDDLEVLKADKPITIGDEEVIPINSTSTKLINVNRTPIFNRENKKILLVIFNEA
jgi:PAS domain S-box-containing protein